jgi:exopolysaccharide/PEP-CTERM locus tyrosine autokinase
MSVAMEYDSRVLLVDGDVAHPSMPAILGTPHAPGLLDLLTRDDIDVADALVKTNVERLTLLPAGSRQRRSTELLASEQMASLLRELSSRYPDRIIIFDSPPLLATTEARVLATHMGQIVMVVAANATRQHAVQQALATIESCDIVLMLLNKASRDRCRHVLWLLRGRGSALALRARAHQASAACPRISIRPRSRGGCFASRSSRSSCRLMPNGIWSLRWASKRRSRTMSTLTQMTHVAAIG